MSILFQLWPQTVFMDEEMVGEIVVDVMATIPSEMDVPVELVRRLIQVAFERQHDSNRDELLRQVKELFEQFGYGLGGSELIIQQMELHNWISFSETMLSISQWDGSNGNVILIHGETSKGKTSLTSALRWVISGDLRIERKVGGNTAKLPRK